MRGGGFLENSLRRYLVAGRAKRLGLLSGEDLGVRPGQLRRTPPATKVPFSLVWLGYLVFNGDK